MNGLVGKRVIYGMQEIKPITNLPLDALQVKIRLRPRQFGVVVVRRPDRVERYNIEPVGDQWQLFNLHGVNVAVERKRDFRTFGNLTVDLTLVEAVHVGRVRFLDGREITCFPKEAAALGEYLSKGGQS